MCQTNYGKFNLRFIGAKIWNTISDDKKRIPKHSRKQLSPSATRLWNNVDILNSREGHIVNYWATSKLCYPR